MSEWSLRTGYAIGRSLKTPFTSSRGRETAVAMQTGRPIVWVHGLLRVLGTLAMSFVERLFSSLFEQGTDFRSL
jgi:hypothetical protein